jgi:hypothetical protein
MAFCGIGVILHPNTPRRSSQPHDSPVVRPVRKEHSPLSVLGLAGVLSMSSSLHIGVVVAAASLVAVSLSFPCH